VVGISTEVKEDGHHRVVVVSESSRWEFNGGTEIGLTDLKLYGKTVGIARKGDGHLALAPYKDLTDVLLIDLISGEAAPFGTERNK